MTKEIEVLKKGEVQAMTPNRLLEIAVQGNADVDKLEKLMELQIRWEDREAEKAFNEASSAFRSECPTIAKTLTGHQSKYAGLSETIDQIKPLLLKNGLSYTWKTGQDGENISVTCKVTHLQGHSEETSLSAAPDTSGSKQPIQAIGSTVSYLQRYTLYAVLGLTSSEMDNDGGNIADSELCTVKQSNEILEQMTELDVKTDIFYKVLKIKDLSEMTVDKYHEAISQLNIKREQVKK